RDVDRHRLLGAHHAPTLTLGARIGDDLALAIAPIAQRHIDELAKDRLLHAADLAAALALGALGPLAAWLHAATRATRAIGVLGQADLFARAEDRLFEREMQVITQVLTALNALARAALAWRAEERLEQILNGQPDEVAEVNRAGAAAALERGVAIAIVGAALFGVRQHLVGLSGLLEALGGFGRIVAIRVKLQGQAAVGLLDVVVGAAPTDAQHFVIVAL